jgi:hypothetical protein
MLELFILNSVNDLEVDLLSRLLRLRANNRSINRSEEKQD